MTAVFITGASGTGKSTTMHALREKGFEPSPLYLTRPARLNETHGVDAFFVSEEAFGRLVLSGHLLEKTLEEAKYGGNYYGSPVQWMHSASAIEGGGDICATPANTSILSRMKHELGSRGLSGSYLWVNLYAQDHVRLERLIARNHLQDPDELHIRMNTGVSQGIQADACLNLDTSELPVEEVVSNIVNNIK